MGRSKGLLVFWLMLVVITIPVQAGTTDNYGTSGLLIITTPYVRMGEFKTDPVNPALEYFEAEEALNFLILTWDSKWQVFLSGVDFVSGVDQIPLEQMEWKLGGNKYHKMPRAGKEEIILTHEQASGFLQYHSLSFRLALQGDEAPGRYNSTLTLTMIYL